MEVLQALVLKANLDLGNSQTDPTLQKIKGVAEDCLQRAHKMGIVRYGTYRRYTTYVRILMAVAT